MEVPPAPLIFVLNRSSRALFTLDTSITSFSISLRVGTDELCVLVLRAPGMLWDIDVSMHPRARFAESRWREGGRAMGMEAGLDGRNQGGVGYHDGTRNVRAREYRGTDRNRDRRFLSSCSKGFESPSCARP